MDSAKIEERIAEANRQLDALKAQMEKICLEFIFVTKEYLPKFFQEFTENIVVKDLGNTNKLGLEVLHNMKLELKEITDVVPDIVERHLNIEKYWPHRWKNLDKFHKQFGRYDIYEHESPIELDNGVREMLGYIGHILLKYGYADYSKHSAWELRPGYDFPMYRHDYQWSVKMDEQLQKYCDLYDQFIKAVDELKQAQRDKDEALAKETWHKA